jgi:hypothetical protein
VICGERGDRVFGGIERDSRKCFLVKVPNKNTDRLSYNLCIVQSHSQILDWGNKKNLRR